MKILYSVGTPDNQFCVTDARNCGLGFVVGKVLSNGREFITSCDTLEDAKNVAATRAAEAPTFDTTLLRTAIRVAGGAIRVAEEAGMKADALRRSLNGKRDFSFREMTALSEVLLIPKKEIERYFFRIA